MDAEHCLWDHSDGNPWPHTGTPCDAACEDAVRYKHCPMCGREIKWEADPACEPEPPPEPRDVAAEYAETKRRLAEAIARDEAALERRIQAALERAKREREG